MGRAVRMCVALLSVVAVPARAGPYARPESARARLAGALGVLPPLLACVLVGGRVAAAMGLEDAAALIRDECAQALAQARATGRLLYRGERPSLDQPLTVSTASDLFFPATYASIAAASYFIALNNTRLSPSPSPFPVYKAHVATPSLVRASQWGQVCSVWPLQAFQYLWLKDSPLLWEPAWASADPSPGARVPPFFWQNGKRGIHGMRGMHGISGVRSDAAEGAGAEQLHRQRRPG